MSITIFTQRLHHDNEPINPITVGGSHKIYLTVWESQAEYGISELTPDSNSLFLNEMMDYQAAGVFTYQWEDPAPDLTYYYRVRAFMDATAPDSFSDFFGEVQGGKSTDDSATISLLYPRILPYVPGCPSNVALQMGGRVFTDFCEETHAWRETLSITTTSGVDEYELNPAAGYVLCVLSVKDNGAITSVDEFLPKDQKITLSYVPNQTRSLEVDVAIAPVNATDSFPQYIYQRYGDALASGTLAMLMAMDGTPWKNPQMAEVHKSIYDGGIAKAKGFYLRNGLTAAPRFMFPRI